VTAGAAQPTSMLVCDCCGAGGRIKTVAVERRRDRRREHITLCERCRTSKTRAWRLAWRIVEGAA
jgi:hypothetical protein